MDAGAYFRVSSDADALARHRGAIERLARTRGDRLGALYTEHARTFAHPELGRLRDDVRSGHLRRLYVYELAHLAVTHIADAFDTLRELLERRCDVVAVADGVHLAATSTPAEILVLFAWAAKTAMAARAPAVAPAMAQQIKRRVGQCLAAARSSRGRGGSPALGWRYSNRGGRHLEPVATEQSTLERILELDALGHSLRAIAATLSDEGRRTKTGACWHPTTVDRVLRRARRRAG